MTLVAEDYTFGIFSRAPGGHPETFAGQGSQRNGNFSGHILRAISG
ncbi:MAG: hypothetical protein Q8M64_04185 [Methyloversatilis sp.]|nr:hypothetical protein [Methyloversatilis sp.]